MADWNQPTVSTNYATVLTELKNRDAEAYSLGETPTNPAVGFIRWNRTLDKFQEWDGLAWVDQVISLAGGGTGGIDASSARTSLGLGSIAVQNNNAVNITGGTISGLTSLDVVGNSVIAGRLDVLSTAVNSIETSGGIRAGSGNIDIINTAGKIPELSASYFSSLTIQGSWTFASALTINPVSGLGLTIDGLDPAIIFHETDAGVDEKYWRLLANGGSLFLQLANDPFGAAVNILTVDRTGTTPDLFTFAAPVTVPILNTVQINSSASIGLLASGGSIELAASTQVNMGISGLSIQVVSGGISFVSGLAAALFYADSNRNFVLSSHTLGVVTAGPSIIVGRNASGLGAPGTLTLQDKDGIFWKVWVDTTGDLRIGATAPVEGGVGSDTIGTIVGTQS